MKKHERLAKKREKMKALAWRRLVKRYGEPKPIDWSRAAKVFKEHYASLAAYLYNDTTCFDLMQPEQGLCGEVFREKIPTTKE